MVAIVSPGIIVPGAGLGTRFGGWINAGAFHIGPAIPILTLSTGPASQDQLTLAPFRVSEPHVATHVVFENTSGTQNTRVGLYRVDASAINLLAESANTALGGTGVQEIDIADTTLLPGVTYLAGGVHSTGAMTYRTVATSISPYSDFPTFGAVAGAGPGLYLDAHAFGDLPSTLTFTNNSGITSGYPYYRLKVSS